MAEATEALVSVPMGVLTDADYEEAVLAAMPSVKTEVVPTVEIAAEPEKLVDPIVVAQAMTEVPKPRRICGECNHPDNNSVGKIKLGEMIEIERDGMKLRAVKPICNVCFEKKPPQERARVGKIGYLISEVGLANRRVYAARDALAYWTAFKAGEAEPLQVRKDASGKILCGVPGCRLCHDGELATRFVVIRTAEGKYEVAGIGQEQFMLLLKAGALKSIQLFDYYRRAAFEAERRDKKAADEAAKKPLLVVVETKPVESAKPQLSRAEREARRWDRRRKLALAVGNTRFGAGKRHKGGQKGSNGGGKKR